MTEFELALAGLLAVQLTKPLWNRFRARVPDGVTEVLLAAALTAAVGLLGSLRALQARPMEVLRGD